MENPVLQITISPTYFLGITGILISGAWYFAKKFSKVETTLSFIQRDNTEMKSDFKKMNETLTELKYGQRELKNLYKNK